MIHVQIKSKKSFQIHSHLNDENDEQIETYQGQVMKHDEPG